jgi:KDO2-lipid IV(A) lauroyltransferase
VPFFPRRLPDAEGYVLDILPPLEAFPGGDQQSDTQRLSHIIEQQVKDCPEQYLWVHRRFKSRPKGVPPVYKAPDNDGKS